MFYWKQFLAKQFRTNLPETCAQTPCAQTLRTNPAHKLRTHLAHKPCAQTPSTKSRLWQGGVCTRRTHKHPAHKVRAQAPRTKRTSPHKPHKLRTNPHKPHKPCAQKEFFSIKYYIPTWTPNGREDKSLLFRNVWMAKTWTRESHSRPTIRRRK